MPFNKIKSQTEYKNYVIGGGSQEYSQWLKNKATKKSTKKK